MALIPTTNEEAHGQQIASQFFHLVGNVLGGADADPRMEPGMTGGVLLGPRHRGTDIGVGSNGEVYLRGSNGAASSAAPSVASQIANLQFTPLAWLLLIAGAAYLLLRK
jgi:hypothetical protein